MNQMQQLRNDIANAYARQNSHKGQREMTADDLGLPLGQWTVEWLTRMYGRPMDFIQPKYEFWLGAAA